MSEVKVSTVLFCDDVRQEVGDKFSLLGVYQDAIVIQRVPIRLPTFAVFLQLEIVGKAPKIVDVVVRTPTGESVEIRAEQPEGFECNFSPQVVTIPVKTAQLPLNSVGEIIADVKVDDEHLYTAKLPVILSSPKEEGE